MSGGWSPRPAGHGRGSPPKQGGSGRKGPSTAELQLQLLTARPVDARAELGRLLPSRAAVHAQARELLELARRAEEFAGTGPTRDLAAALRQLERMRVVLGAGQ